MDKFLDIQSNAKSLLDNVSFSVVRTNPKLTTNVKIVTNGESVWLDSYSATKELSEDRYKAYWVSGKGCYNRDLANFYKGLDFVVPYAVYQNFDDLTIKTSYDQQYETMYWCGAESINSLEYDEELGIVAPLWIEDKIPERFVVFRVDGPSYVNIKEYLKSRAASRTSDNDSLPELDFKNDILDKCRIVKSFDLTENSFFGAYLHRYRDQEDFPKVPLKVSFEKGKETVYNGISIEKGGFMNAHEYNYSKYFEDDIPITSFDEFVTLGFERNRLACANLLNIEFLFNDDTAEDYTINRYFGMYCNLVEDGTLRLDFQGFGRLSTENASDMFASSINEFVPAGTYIENIKGVVLPTSVVDGQQRFPNKPNVVDKLDSVFYLKDVHGELHSIKRGAESSSALQAGDIRLSDGSVDVNAFTGFVTNGEYIDAELVEGGACSQLEMKVVGQIPPASFINIYDGSEPGSPVFLGCVESDFAPDPDDPANSLLIGGWHEGNMFCGDGTPEQVAYAMTQAMNSVGVESIVAYACNDTVIVKSINANEHYNKFYIEFVQQGTGECLVFNSDDVGTDHYFYGGSSFKYLRVRDDDSYHFKVGNYLRTNNTKGYGRIIYKYIDKSDAVVNGENVIVGFAKSERYYNIILDTDDAMVGTNSQVAVYEEFYPTFGRLGFYPIRDFDFSTKEKPTIYGDIGELNDEYFTTERNVQEGGEGVEVVPVDDFEFQVPDGTTITVDITTPSDDGICVYGVNGATVVSLGNGEYEVTVSLAVLSGQSFGMSTHIDTGEFCFETISSTLNGKKEYISNEYDRCFENHNKELMLLSKTAPYIGKWVCVENGLDVREKPYRLNTSLAFGVNSFSPNPYTFIPMPDEYNQEWTYIFDEIPFSDSVVRNCWSYLGGSLGDLPQHPSTLVFGDGTENLENLLRDRTKDWFEILFVQDYAYRKNESGTWNFFDHLDYRRKYSILEHGSTNTNSDTFFRGVKVEVLQKVDYSEELDNNLNNIKTVFGDELNGYRFSVVIVPYTMDYPESVEGKKTKVIRNDVFRFIVVLVYSAKEIKDAKARLIGSSASSVKFNNYTRYLLYKSEDVADKLYGTTDPTVCTYGEGKIRSVTDAHRTYNGDELFYLIGDNTNFLTEIKVDEDGSINKLVLMKYPPEGSSSQVQLTQFTIVELQSDSVLTAVIDPSSTVVVPLPSGFTYVSDAAIVDDSNIHNGIYLLQNKHATALVDQADNCVYGNLFYNINHFQKGNVVYEQVTADGFYSSEDGQHTYALRLIPPELNAKYNYMKMYSDGEYVYYGARADSAVQISRQGWYYMPLFRDVVYFKDPAVDVVSSGMVPSLISWQRPFLENSRYCNTVFAHDYEGFGIVRCLEFHRANDVNNNVFDLYDDERPLYPTSNKFSIGYRDVNVFNSSFDPYYYTETNSATLETEIHGTANMVEYKSFLGSKYMKVPDSFDLEDFSVSSVKTLPAPTSDVAYLEGKGKVEFSVNVIQRIVEYFTPIVRDLFSGYIDEHYSYGDKSTIDDDIECYIKSNILPLYRVEKVDLYVRSEKSGDYTPVCDYTAFSLDDRSKSAGKMAPARNVSVVSIGEEMLDKKVSYNVMNGMRYWFGMSVRIVKK